MLFSPNPRSNQVMDPHMLNLIVLLNLRLSSLRMDVKKQNKKGPSVGQRHTEMTTTSVNV